MKHSIMEKRVGYCLIFMALFLIINYMPEVKAEQETSGSNSRADAACNKALYSGDMLTADYQNNKIIIHAKEGKWKIKYAIDDDSDASSADYSLVLGKKANPKKFNYSGGTNKEISVGEGKAIFLVAEPVADDDGHIVKADGSTLKVEYTKSNGSKDTTTCKAGKVYINTSNSIVIEDTAAFISSKFQATSNVNITIDEASHPNEYKECMAMKLARLNYEDNESYLSSQSDINQYNAQMQSSFPYCYGTYSSSFEITADTIKSVRQKSLKAYKQYLDFLSAQQNNDEYDNAVRDEIENTKLGYKFLEYGGKEANKTIINTLKCQKDQTTENTERFYTRVEEAKNDLCIVTCQEQIQVTYDPPVATKAGLCFQYKVTVKSKVTCKTEKNGDIKWPTPPETCDFSPICSGNAQETQAGPIEEFDSCIQNCDGGKYSQTCINSCYKKVYENKDSNAQKTSSSTTKTSNNTTSLQNNSESILKLESTNDEYHNIEGCKTNAEIKKNASTCAQKFYELKQKDPRGHYEKDNSTTWYTHIWKKDSNVAGTTLDPSTDDWIESIKRSSPYYFRDYATSLKTIQSFYGVNNGLNGYGEARKYIIDNGGVKRQRTNSYKCYEVCGFISNSSDNCVSNNEALVTYYSRIYDLIETSLSQCTSKAECKEGEATFDMSVDNKAITADDQKDNPSEWSAKNKTNNDAQTCYNPTGDIKMFIPLGANIDLENNNNIYGTNCSINPNNGINGKCYGKDNKKYWQHYKTTITFPGTWIDLKTGRRYYHNDSNNTSTLREKPNYYCVGYNYKPVNEQWWDWKINQNADPDKLSSVTKKITYNIFAEFKDFGKYNWGFSDEKQAIKCFYALSNKVTTCTGENCNPSCTGDECYTTIDNVRLRPVDQSDLFAGRTGNQIGFNWTSAAQDEVAEKASNENAKSYGIDPGEYAKELQKEAKAGKNSVYSGEVDYSLHLTKENIKSIRSYVKTNGYTSYQGKGGNKIYKEVPGIDLYYYTSGILDNNAYTTDFTRNATLGKNND